MGAPLSEPLFISGREARHLEALTEAKRWEEDPHTLWTDGSALPSGVAAAAVVGYVEPGGAETSPERVSITSRGGLGTRLKNNRRSKGRRYDMMTRSIVKRDGRSEERL